MLQEENQNAHVGSEQLAIALDAIDRRFNMLRRPRRSLVVGTRSIGALDAYLRGVSGNLTSERITIRNVVRFGIALQNDEPDDVIIGILSRFSVLSFYPEIVAFCCGTEAAATLGLKIEFEIDLHAVAPPHLPLNETMRIRNMIAQRLSSMGISLPVDIEDLRTLNFRVAKVRGKKPFDFEELSNFLGAVQQSVWPYFFADAFRLLRAMFKHDLSLSLASLDETHRVCHACGLEIFFSQMLMVRALSGHAAEQAYLIQNQARYGDARLPRKLIVWVRQTLSGRRATIAIEDVQSYSQPLAKLIGAIVYVLASDEEHAFLKRLAAAYEVDEALPDFLNWQSLGPLLDKTAGINLPHLVFMSTLASSDRVVARYPFLFHSYWVGGATADLESYAMFVRGRSKELGLGDFLTSLATLPPKARAKTFKHLFSPTVIERLASLLTTPITKRLGLSEGADEFKSLHAQLAILDFVETHRVLSPEFVHQRREDIRKFMRFLKYSTHKSGGMIRIDPLDVENELLRFLATSGDEYLGIYYGVNESADVILEIVSQQLAQLVTRYICFNSRVAFDYVLSNRLRHGWLERRLERAVLDAKSSVRSSILDWANLLDQVDAVVKRFNSIELTLSESSRYFEAIAKTTADWFRRELPNGREALRGNAISRLSTDLIAHLHTMLEHARQRWKFDYKEDVLVLCNDSAREVDEKDRPVVQDHLLANFDAAFTETERWIRVNSRELNHQSDVQLRSLIEFEARTIAVNDPPENGITFEVYDGDAHGRRRHGFDVLIPAKYVGVLTTLADIAIQNAIDKSGLRHSTLINIIVSFSSARVQLSFTNTFRKSELSRIKRNIAHAQQILTKANLMNSGELLASRRIEGGGGLIKVIYECRETFEKGFNIEVSEDLLSDGWFCVKADLPIVAAKLVPPDAVPERSS